MDPEAMSCRSHPDPTPIHEYPQGLLLRPRIDLPLHGYTILPRISELLRVSAHAPFKFVSVRCL